MKTKLSRLLLENISVVENTNIVILEKENKFGLFDSIYDELILGIEYDTIDRLSKSIYRVRHDNKRGLFDTNSKKFILDIKYDRIYHLGGQTYGVTDDGKTGMFNNETRELVVPE